MGTMTRYTTEMCLFRHVLHRFPLKCLKDALTAITDENLLKLQFFCVVMIFFLF